MLIHLPIIILTSLVSRAVKLAGTILCRPVLGGLHHQYVRI